MTGERYSTSRLMVLDARGPASADLIAAARRNGHEVLAVWPEGAKERGDVPAGVEDHVVDFSSEGVLADLAALATRTSVEGVVTTDEYLTPLVARLCEELSLPGNDTALCEAARDKALMANRFGRCGVAVPTTFVFTEVDEVRDHLIDGSFSFPLVVKPATGAGSKGVTVVRSVEQLSAAVDRVRAQRQPFSLEPDRRLVVQEYVEGKEFSVESVTQHGETTHVCITRKITTGGSFRAEVGHSVPAQLDDRATARVLAETARAIAAVGIRNTLSHSEVILRPNGECKVIEIAARIGAGQIGELVRLALGVDLPEASVSVALGIPVLVHRTNEQSACVRMLTSPRCGRLRAVRNMPLSGGDISAATLTKKIGATVAGPEDNGGRLGYLIVTGPDERTANGRADEVLRDIEIIVEPHDEAGKASISA